MILNMGPQHPSTHGVLRVVIELDGEEITNVWPDVGYLHRGDEKIAENMTYTQFIPYTDRLDYLAPLANNVAYSYAVEKLCGIDVPPRCKYIRVICAELARISSHLLGIGAMAHRHRRGDGVPLHFSRTGEDSRYLRMHLRRAIYDQLHAHRRPGQRSAAQLSADGAQVSEGIPGDD